MEMTSIWNFRSPGARSLNYATVLFAFVALLWASVQGAEAAPIPSGSYQQSCQNIRANYGVLKASCQTRRGGYIYARLDNYPSCRGDIANADGRLICKEIPGDLILFENSYFRGRWLAINADAANLPRWLNDRTSSIRVRRGIWRVCTDWNFRGRCEIIRGDFRDLNVLRLNDRISSVRRVLPRPEGSYLQSCANIRFDGRFLSADCRDRRGRVSSSRLDVRTCPPGSDIFVRRGELRCGDRRGYDDDRDDYNDNNDNYDNYDNYGDGRVPRGTYVRTCRNVRMDDSMLRAECQDRNGNWRRTALDVSNCRRDISNNDGELICGDAGNPLPPPPRQLPQGSYQQSCRNMDVDRGTLSGECRTTNGEWRAASLALRSCPQGADIRNDNGVLSCTNVAPPPPPPPPPPGTRQPPDGSYRQSCRNLSVERGTLKAECQDATGAWKETSIGLRDCRGAPDISNTNGTLTCVVPPGAVQTP